MNLWTWVLVGQISFWGGASYPDAAFGSLWWDFSGDGMSDPVVSYVDSATGALDSIVVYDGLSRNRLAAFIPDPGFEQASLFGVPGGGGAIFVQQYYDYAGGGLLQFRVFSPLTQEIFASPVFSGLRSGFVSLHDATGDGAVDIVVDLIYPDSVAILVYTTPWTGIQENPGVSGGWRVDLRAGAVLHLPLLPRAGGVLEIRDVAGRTVRKRVRPGQAILRLDLPPGVYTYRLQDGRLTLSGKLWRQP